EAFLESLQQIAKSDMLPAAKRHALVMAWANKLLSEGISVGARLMEHAMRDHVGGSADVMDEVLKSVKRPVTIDEAGFARGKTELRATRTLDANRVGIPSHLRADLDMMALARKYSGRDIRVVRDETLHGATAEVRYSLDRFGFINEVYIALGTGAGHVQM